MLGPFRQVAHDWYTLNESSDEKRALRTSGALFSGATSGESSIIYVVNRMRATYPFMVNVWQCVCQQMKEPGGRWKSAKIKSGPQTKFQIRRFSARTSGLSLLTETTISYI